MTANPNLNVQFHTCGVCREALAVRSVGGKVIAHVHHLPDTDHAPVPVPSSELAPIQRCDFCSVDDPSWVFTPRSDYRVRRLVTEQTGEYHDPLGRSHKVVRPKQRAIAQRGDVLGYSASDWTACDECATLVEALDYARLARRYQQMHGDGRGLSQVRKHFRELVPTLDRTRKPFVAGAPEGFIDWSADRGGA